MSIKYILVRFILLMTCVMLTLLSTGCYGLHEIDDLAFVTVVGIDKAGDKDKVTYQIAVPPKKGAANPGEEQSPRLISIFLSPSIPRARMLLNTTIPRPPDFSHITTFIISEEKAREGLGPLLALFIRDRTLRENMFLIIVQGSAEEYINQNKPVLEDQIYKYYEATLNSHGFGNFLKVQLHDLYNRMKNPGGSAYTVYSGINPKTGKDNPQDGKTPEQKGDPYLPGGLPRKGTNNAVEFLGLAVFREDKLVGVLDTDETRAIAILQNKFENSYIGLIDPLAPKKDTVNINVLLKSKPKITPETLDDKLVFHIDVKLEGELLGVTSYINYENQEYRQLLEAQTANLIKGQIMKMLQHTQSLGTDPVGLGLYLRPDYTTTTDLQNANLTALYQAAEMDVTVTFKLRRPGLLRQSSPKSKGGTI